MKKIFYHQLFFYRSYYRGLCMFFLTSYILIIFSCNAFGQTDTTNFKSRTEQNKILARSFYQDLWFSNQTDNYSKYVADYYIVHDVGDRKNKTEPAIEQKNIADFFWKNGHLSGEIDYMIAEEDRVATRWIWHFEPRTLFGKVILRKMDIAIINVFKFKEGKIVEIWNHRHDIDTSATLPYTIKGVLIGLIIALIPTIIAIRLRRKLKNIRRSSIQ